MATKLFDTESAGKLSARDRVIAPARKVGQSPSRILSTAGTRTGSNWRDICKAKYSLSESIAEPAREGKGKSTPEGEEKVP